ncbi:MAG: PD-(D/E)XK nuclease family protein [Polyangiaceae bacterium]
MKRAFVSGSVEARLGPIREYLEGLPSAREVVLLGPSRGALDDLVRAIVAKKGALFGLHRKTLAGWAAELSAPKLADEGRVVAPPLAIDAAILGAIARSVDADELRYLSRDAARADAIVRAPTFPRTLLATLSDLRAAAIPPDALLGEDARRDDIGRLLARFEEELASRALADPAHVRRTAAACAADTALTRAPLVAFDVAVRSAADEALLSALIELATEAIVVLPSGDVRAARACAAAGIEPAPIPEVERTSLARARSRLFAVDPGERAENDASIELFSAPTQAHEATEVVRRVVGSGAPLDDVAIVIPSRRTYATHVEGALSRAGVKGWFSFGTRRPHPAGRALLALLGWKLDRYSAKRLVEYFSLGQVPDAPRVGEVAQAFAPIADEDLGRFGEGVQPEDPDDDPEPAPAQVDEASPAAPARYGGLRTPHRWEAVVGESGTRAGLMESGQRYYERRLRAFMATRQRERDAIAREDADSPAIARLERDVGDAAALMSFLDPLLAELDAMPVEAPFGEWLTRVERVALLGLRTPELVLAALRELRPFESARRSLADVVDTLRPRLTELDRPRPQRRYGRVFVGTPNDLRGRSFREVYALGLTERVFPARLREDPLLFEEDRRALSARLPTNEDRAADERLALALVVGAARDRVVLSYPRMDAEVARPRVPSFYALDVLRAVTGALPDVDEMLVRAAERGDARLEWPAPRDPAQAIDAFERDLAEIQVLIGRAPEARRGRARWILEENAFLAAALRTRYRRQDRDRFYEADGLVAPSAYVQRELAARSLKSRPYSPSALQHYAACPLRFFLFSVLGLEHREAREEVETLDPITRGELFHDVMAKFLHALRARRTLPIPTSAIDDAVALLEELFAREARDVAARIEPTVPRIFEADRDAVLEDLTRVVRDEFIRAAPFTPAYADLAFGLGAAGRPHRDPRSVADPVRLPGGYLLRGAIDSVEVSQNGLELRVTDYKTGKAPAASSASDRSSAFFVTGQGEVLQPVLYALAAEALRGVVFNEQQRVVASRLFYATKRGAFAERTVGIDDDSKRRGRAVLEAIDDAVVAGFLPAFPREDACKTCDARACCGPKVYEENRAKRAKSAEDRTHVERLIALRREP